MRRKAYSIAFLVEDHVVGLHDGQADNVSIALIDLKLVAVDPDARGWLQVATWGNR